MTPDFFKKEYEKFEKEQFPMPTEWEPQIGEPIYDLDKRKKEILSWLRSHDRRLLGWLAGRIERKLLEYVPGERNWSEDEVHFYNLSILEIISDFKKLAEELTMNDENGEPTEKTWLQIALLSLSAALLVVIVVSSVLKERS